MNTPLIVLTVGTDSHPYDRAVRWIDAWAAANPDARVVAQWGTSTRARHAEGDALLPRPALEALLREADAVVVRKAVHGRAQGVHRAYVARARHRAGGALRRRDGRRRAAKVARLRRLGRVTKALVPL